MRKLCGAGTDFPSGSSPRLKTWNAVSGLIRELLPSSGSIYVDETVSTRLGWRHFYHPSASVAVSPQDNKHVAQCMARQHSRLAFRPGALNGKTELCTPLSEAPCSFLPRSCVSCASSQLCPAFPESCAKPAPLSAPNRRELKTRIRTCG